MVGGTSSVGMERLSIARRLFPFFVPIVLLIAGCSAQVRPDRIVLLHTNDTHGYDMRTDGHHGMATVAAYRRELQDRGFDVILLDAGDAIQDNNLVNLSKGRTAIAFMNAAGYDAAAIGNHEFDYGQDELMKRTGEARFPFLSSNIIVEATGERFAPPHAIIDRGGVRVGVIGITTPSTMTSTTPKYVRGLRFLSGRRLYAEVRSQVAELRRKRCDVIVVLGHLGGIADCEGNRSEDVLANVDGIDVFIDGHDHMVKNRRVGGALLVEAGHRTTNIGMVTFRDGMWRGEVVPYAAYAEEAPDVKALIADADATVRAELDIPVGRSEVTLHAARAPGVRTREMPLGDFVADAFLWQARRALVVNGPIHAAMVNGGCLRASLRRGKVSLGDIFAVLPYRNRLYVVTVSGGTLLEILEAATAATPEPSGGFPHVAGIRYEVDTRVRYAKDGKYPDSALHAPARPGARVTISEVGGRPFDADAMYTVCMPEFLVQGGDTYAALTVPGACKDMRGIGYTETEAVRHYIVSALGGVITDAYAKPKGRIVIRGGR